MPDVDFKELKACVPILDVAIKLLGLTDLKPTGTDKDTGAAQYRRSHCPICNATNPRRWPFVITVGKGWFCHAKCGTGGDLIKLVRLVKNIEPRDAALMIQNYFGAPRADPERTQILENILKRLEPEHESVQALGISAETATLFESGFNPSGKQSGRYSVALRDIRGTLVAFAGVSLTGEETAYSNFDPASLMFNCHRLSPETELMVMRSPLDAILAVEAGAPIDSVTSFLTESVNSHQLELLAGLLDHLKIDHCFL